METPQDPAREAMIQDEDGAADTQTPQAPEKLSLKANMM